MTTFHEIYDLFLSEVIDVYFIDYEEQKIEYNDLQNILVSAIARFKHPKKDLRNYELNFFDEERIPGQFSEELDIEEKELLVNYMGIKWAENKLKRGRITQLQYTGSDAKAINIKTHIEGINSILKTLKTENKVLNNNYQAHSGNKIKLRTRDKVRDSIPRPNRDER